MDRLPKKERETRVCQTQARTRPPPPARPFKPERGITFSCWKGDRHLGNVPRLRWSKLSFEDGKLPPKGLSLKTNYRFMEACHRRLSPQVPRLVSLVGMLSRFKSPTGKIRHRPLQLENPWTPTQSTSAQPHPDQVVVIQSSALPPSQWREVQWSHRVCLWGL